MPQQVRALMKNKEWYRRSLPHLQPIDGTFNICFRLHGSLPISKIKEIKAERAQQLEALKKIATDLSPRIFLKMKFEISNDYFGKFDSLLDNPTSGPIYLGRTSIAKIVQDGLHFWDGKRFRLICYCIMPNHVHLMIDSCEDQLFTLLKSIKTYTARLSNQELGRTGNPFWHKESYDNLVRNPRQLAHKAKYILNNPVKAGLVDYWEDWQHTYLSQEFSWIL